MICEQFEKVIDTYMMKRNGNILDKTYAYSCICFIHIWSTSAASTAAASTAKKTFHTYLHHMSSFSSQSCFKPVCIYILYSIHVNGFVLRQVVLQLLIYIDAICQDRAADIRVHRMCLQRTLHYPHQSPVCCATQQGQHPSPRLQVMTWHC